MVCFDSKEKTLALLFRPSTYLFLSLEYALFVNSLAVSIIEAPLKLGQNLLKGSRNWYRKQGQCSEAFHQFPVGT